MRTDPDIRFWSKVDARGICWDWTAALQPDGYGYFWYIDRMVYAHRWVWERLVGAIPEGLTIDHICRNRACINPDHLEPVTQAENVRRAHAYMIGAAKQRAKTQCPSGHPLSGDNLYVTPDNKRRCRICRRDSLRRSRARRMPVITYRPGQPASMQLLIEVIP